MKGWWGWRCRVYEEQASVWALPMQVGSSTVTQRIELFLLNGEMRDKMGAYPYPLHHALFASSFTFVLRTLPTSEEVANICADSS